MDYHIVANLHFMIILELGFAKGRDRLSQQLLRVHLREIVDFVLRKELA